MTLSWIFPLIPTNSGHLDFSDEFSKSIIEPCEEIKFETVNINITAAIDIFIF